MALVLVEDIWIFPVVFLCIATFVFAIRGHANEWTRLVLAAIANAIIIYTAYIIYLHYGVGRVILHLSLIILLIWLSAWLFRPKRQKEPLQTKE